MSTTADSNAAVKAQAEEIVTSGTDIRPRLAEVVARSAGEARHSGGLVTLVRAVIDGSREGLTRAVSQDREGTLRQVVDALADGLSLAALAGQLALQEAGASSRQYAKEDLTDLHDDLSAVHDLFAETVERGVSAGKALTTGQVAAARRHAERVAEHLKPAIARALDAVRQHPTAFAREGLQAGVSAGQCATGALFQALGRMLQRAGDQMRQEDGPTDTPSGDRRAKVEGANKTTGSTWRRSS
jgi:hypothetical protein